MANQTTPVDTIEVRDLEDNSCLTVVVQACTELGNEGRPGLRVLFMGNILNLDPARIERWAWQARKAGKDALLLEEHSWNVHADQYIRNTLLMASPPRIRIEVKTRSRAAPVVREYPLPFALEA